MTAALLALFAVTLAAVALWRTFHRPDLLTDRVRRRAIVTRRDGTGFVGVLLEADRRCVVLTGAETENERGQLVPVDGEVLVLAEDIAHIQFP